MTLNLILSFFIFLFGLAVGSFLNSIIYRLQTGENFLITRSYCPNCKKILSWQDLIPLLSFLILKGKCRYCKNPISCQYPLVEFAAGLLFVFIAQNQLIISPLFTHSNQQLTVSSFLNFFYLLIVSCFLIIIFVSDLKYYIISDKIIYPAIGITFLYQLFGNWKFEIGNLEPLINSLLSAVLASAFFLLIVLVSRGKWMGWGDPKLAFFMGLFLGFPDILLALFFAFLIGAIIGIGLIILKKKRLKSEVPFGPFLVAGTFIALFWGKEIVNWYLSLF